MWDVVLRLSEQGWCRIDDGSFRRTISGLLLLGSMRWDVLPYGTVVLEGNAVCKPYRFRHRRAGRNTHRPSMLYIGRDMDTFIP